uniref:Uncharacterized protein n=1 Tax=Leersia perrieri TaxID=77586 RepID=A0A0D9W5T1_9ORYZ
MRGISLALPVLVLAIVLLASGFDAVLAVRTPAAFAETSRRSVSPEEQSRELTEGGNAVAAAGAFDASVKPAETATDSSPSKVFDPDRMSKRRVRRGSDPIHNKC